MLRVCFCFVGEAKRDARDESAREFRLEWKLMELNFHRIFAIENGNGNDS